MDWTPGFDNAALAGVLTVACTLFAALACGLNAWRARGGARALWMALALALLPLAAIEHFDLHLALLDGARGLARAVGRAILLAVATIGLAIGAVAAAFMVRWGPRVGPGLALALAGTLFVVGFVAFRAAFFDQLDDLVGFTLAGPSSYRLPELAGLAVIFVGARIGARRSGPRREGGAEPVDGVASLTAAPARRSRDS